MWAGGSHRSAMRCMRAQFRRWCWLRRLNQHVAPPRRPSARCAGRSALPEHAPPLAGSLETVRSGHGRRAPHAGPRASTGPVLHKLRIRVAAHPGYSGVEGNDSPGYRASHRRRRTRRFMMKHFLRHRRPSPELVVGVRRTVHRTRRRRVRRRQYAGGQGDHRATQLKNGAVSASKLAKGAVDHSKVKPGSLMASDFMAGQPPAGQTGATGPRGRRGLRRRVCGSGWRPTTPARSGYLQGNWHGGNLGGHRQVRGHVQPERQHLCRVRDR